MGDPLVDVVVVGAGLSGLVCARDLRRRGLTVQVLEARQRCGGRMWAHVPGSGGVRLDLGGQWVGASHQRLIALLEEFGLQRYATHYSGDGLLHWNGGRHRAGLADDFHTSLLFLRPADLSLPAGEVAASLELQGRFQTLVAAVNAASPWSGPGAADLDRLSIAAWLDRQGAAGLARYPLAWLARLGGSGGFELHESSMLHLAWTQAVAPQQEAPETWLVEGGAAQLAERLARELGETVRLGCPVRAISQDRHGVQVCHAGGSTATTVLAAAAAVVAIPPALRLGIGFDPALPADWLGLLQRSPMGSMVKVLAVYPRPFWRDQGLSGLAVGDLPCLELMVDSSAPGGAGVLAGFIAGERAARWQRLEAAARRRAVLNDLVRCWGPAAGEPSELVMVNWNAEAWSGGAFTSFLIPGAWTSYGPIWQQAHGRVLWAGTEASQRWPGYFEGAIEAGLAAAGQVRRLLGGPAD